MDPISLGIAVGAPILGGLIGQDQASKDRAESSRMLRQYLSQVKGIKLPEIADQQLSLEQLQSQGQYSPEMEALIQQQASGMSGVSTDPRLAQTQMQNLDTLQQIAQSGGFDPSVRADLASSLRRMESDAAARQKAIEQQQQMRGTASSGANLALQQMASQSEANRASEISERLAAQAYQNRLNALSGASSQAANIRSQSFSEQAQKAAAQDAINAFNTQASMRRESANVGAKNLAQQQNLAEAQRIADANVGLSNKQQQYNKELLQQRFQNEMTKAGAMRGPTADVAADTRARGDQTAGMWSGIGSGLGAGASAYGNYAQNQDFMDKMFSKKGTV